MACQKFDEPHHLGGLIGSGQVGVGIAQATTLLLQREEGLDARAGRAAERQIVAIEPGRVAPIGDGMEVQREGIGLGEQRGSQGRHPAAERPELVLAGGPIGVVGGEGLLGEDVQPGEEAQGLVEVEVVDVAAPLLVEELQRQQGQDRGGRGDHLRAGIVRGGDEPVEADSGQQGEEQEDAGGARPPPPPGGQVQGPLIGDGCLVRPIAVLAARPARGSSAAVGDEKGGISWPRTWWRNRLISTLKAAGL